MKCMHCNIFQCAKIFKGYHPIMSTNQTHSNRYPFKEDLVINYLRVANAFHQQFPRLFTIPNFYTDCLLPVNSPRRSYRVAKLSRGPQYQQLHFIALSVDFDQGALPYWFASIFQIRQWLHSNNNIWLGMAQCTRGELQRVETKTPARQCGIATLLSYLCFIDDELFQPLRYNLLADNNWTRGNMPGLYNFIHACPRIIYIQRETDVDTRKGNKAFVLAAAAAYFFRFVSFNPHGCRMGTAFDTDFIMFRFNLNDPVDYVGAPLQDFTRKYGFVWYFCRYP